MTGVTDPAEAYFKDGVWGFYSGVWQKLGMVWGFSSQYLEREVALNSGGGVETLTFSTCPTGVARVILGFSGYNNTTIADRIGLEIVTGGTTHMLHMGVSPPIYQTVDCPRPLVLVYPDVLKAVFVGCADGDTLTANAWGYDMELTN